MKILLVVAAMMATASAATPQPGDGHCHGGSYPASACKTCDHCLYCGKKGKHGERPKNSATCERCDAAKWKAIKARPPGDS